MVNHQTDIERWQWHEISKDRGWYLTIEGKSFWVREHIESSLLSQCLDSEEVQAELVFRLKKITRLFSQVTNLENVKLSSTLVY
jgi:hypothetical protein